MSSRISVLLVLVHAVLGGPAVPASADDAGENIGVGCWSFATSDREDPSKQWLTGYVAIGPFVGADIVAKSQDGEPPALSSHPKIVRTTVRCWIQVNQAELVEPPLSDVACHTTEPAQVVVATCAVKYRVLATDTRYLCQTIRNDHGDAPVKACVLMSFSGLDDGVAVEYARVSDRIVRSSIVEA